jgi:hypothetical protein
MVKEQFYVLHVMAWAKFLQNWSNMMLVVGGVDHCARGINITAVQCPLE